MISALIEFLSVCYQQGDSSGMLQIARSILAVIPDDFVALQFMALALFQLGRRDAAIRLFGRAASMLDREPGGKTGACELASSISLREASRPDSGLTDGWRKLGLLLDELGFERLAARSRHLARAVPATDEPGGTMQLAQVAQTNAAKSSGGNGLLK